MSGFTENRAAEEGHPGQSDRVFTWHACKAMLPLVERIARDIAEQSQTLNRLRPELAELERQRKQLNWPERSRRYQLEDQIVAVERNLRTVVSELESLGLAVLDGLSGLVGFPTLVNQRRAYFSWEPGEPGLNWWNYAGDRIRRPVPADWTQQQPLARETPTSSAASRSRPRKKK